MGNFRQTYKCILSIAGSDSFGGAGIQADLKTATLLGVYCKTAVTAVTAQNSQGVIAIQPLNVDIISKQISAAFEDGIPMAIKTGMLVSDTVIESVAKTLSNFPNVPLIVDPVLISSSGHPLVAPVSDSARTMKEKLFPMATLITPNIPEATYLCDGVLPSLEDLPSRCNARAVLLKGGHSIDSYSSTDILITSSGIKYFHSSRINSTNTHGTGCVLSSAIASFLAKGYELEEAIRCAKIFLTEAIDKGKSYFMGEGQGPLYLFP